jgi:hypothetical protein
LSEVLPNAKVRSADVTFPYFVDCIELLPTRKFINKNDILIFCSPFKKRLAPEAIARRRNN